MKFLYFVESIYPPQKNTLVYLYILMIFSFWYSRYPPQKISLLWRYNYIPPTTKKKYHNTPKVPYLFPWKSLKIDTFWGKSSEWAKKSSFFFEAVFVFSSPIRMSEWVVSKSFMGKTKYTHFCWKKKKTTQKCKSTCFSSQGELS